jgi:hypothetical protein
MSEVTLLKGDVPYVVNSRDIAEKIAQGFRYPDLLQLPKEVEDALIKINLIDEPQALRDKLDCTLSQAKEVIKSRPYVSFEDLMALNETLTKPINWPSFQSKIIFDI